MATTTYLMHAAGETLTAESLDELAELTALALVHEDHPSTWRAAAMTTARCAG